MTWDDLNWKILDRLRDGFLSGTAADGPYWKSPDDLAHYDFTYAERIGWKWDHVLDELRLRGWAPPPGDLLDWGCGSGIAGRRVLDQWPKFATDSATTLHLLDHSLLAEGFAAKRARGSFPDLRVKSWDRTTRITTLLVSHVISELGDESSDDLEEIMESVDAIIWLEPGTSTDARKLVEWRERLRNRFRVIYPCPHQETCGMLRPQNDRHWCHHFARPPAGIFADSNWVRFGQRAGIDLRSLPYSALVLERANRPPIENRPPDLGRVVGRPKVFKPYTRLLGCDVGGVQELTLPKRTAPALAKKFDRPNTPRLFQWRHVAGELQSLEPVIKESH